MQSETPSRAKGIPGGEVATAAELVNYQDGAIVSREIVKIPTGNLTFFMFDEGQGLSEHMDPFDALVIEAIHACLIWSRGHQSSREG